MWKAVKSCLGHGHLLITVICCQTEKVIHLWSECAMNYSIIC